MCTGRADTPTLRRADTSPDGPISIYTDAALALGTLLWTVHFANDAFESFMAILGGKLTKDSGDFIGGCYREHDRAAACYPHSCPADSNDSLN